MDTATGQWPGVPCDADGWPFAADIGTFEARRAIGQLVRTALTLPKLADPAKVRKANPVVPYLVAANSLSTELDNVIGDLVDEARIRGCTWTAIGDALGMAKTATQKRFREGITADRHFQIRWEATVVRQTIGISLGLEDAIDEIEEELAGTTPSDRLRHTFDLARASLSAFDALNEELEQDEPDPEKVSQLLDSVRNRNIKLTTMMISSPDQWLAVTEWAREAESPDATNYHTPAAYIYLAMRHIWLATIWTAFPMLDDEPDFQFVMKYVTKADGLMRQMASILMRDDVQDTFSAAINARPD